VLYADLVSAYWFAAWLLVFPFEGLRLTRRPPGRRRPRGYLSWGHRRSRVLYADLVSAYWFADLHLSVDVSASLSWSSRTRRPRRLSPTVHPLVRFRSPPECLELRPPVTSPCRAPSLGFRSPSRYQSVESTSAGFPRPASFRPRRFSRPRRLPPPPTFVGLFHPTTTSGIRSPGVFPLAQPYGLVTRRGPLAG
jgi:hypothetical protein